MHELLDGVHEFLGDGEVLSVGASSMIPSRQGADKEVVEPPPFEEEPPINVKPRETPVHGASKEEVAMPNGGKGNHDELPPLEKEHPITFNQSSEEPDDSPPDASPTLLYFINVASPSGCAAIHRPTSHLPAQSSIGGRYIQGLLMGQP
jgi:hypothetical protein